MEEREQLLLVREFMLALAPVMAKHTLRNSESANPAENAQLTLEWAMYLATSYASCHDMFHAAPENAPQTPDPIKVRLQTVASYQRETGTTTTGVQNIGMRLPPG